MSGTLVGYARVSSVGQSLVVQEQRLRDAGCDPIFAEKQSGRTADDREELARALAYVRRGDTLVITRLDRLARSITDLRRIVDQLQAKGVEFRCLQQGAIDTASSAGRLMLNILGAFAEFEADIRSERQREGVQRAKAAGKYKKGRPPKADPDTIKAALDAGEKPASLARRLGIGRTTLYRLAGRTADAPGQRMVPEAGPDVPQAG